MNEAIRNHVFLSRQTVSLPLDPLVHHLSFFIISWIRPLFAVLLAVMFIQATIVLWFCVRWRQTLRHLDMCGDVPVVRIGVDTQAVGIQCAEVKTRVY